MIENRFASRIASGESFQGTQQLVGYATVPIDHGQLEEPQ